MAATGMGNWLRTGEAGQRGPRARQLCVFRGRAANHLQPPLPWRFGGCRGKFDETTLPPWKRWPKSGLQRINYRKLPEVDPPIDILKCQDPLLVADTICEVVPWKRRWDHHEWLHAVCERVRWLLPDMEPRDVVRIILAFGELYTKRKTHTLLFHNYETYVLLFQALPVEAATSKTLLPLIRVYRRMAVVHEPFVRAACERVVTGEVELEPKDLAELVRLHMQLRIMAPRLFEFTAEVLDLRFTYFSEDDVGDLARSFRGLRYHSKLFFDVLRRELPYRLHEYAWWNLMDVAELYLDLGVNDREIIDRVGNETYKLAFSMKPVYTAKALKVLTQLETGDRRTFRLLVRTLPRGIFWLPPEAAAESVLALVNIQVEPSTFLHKLPGSRIYNNLCCRLMQCLGALSAKMTCDVLAALAHVGHRQPEFTHAAEAIVNNRPFKFHAEHLVSLLSAFFKLRHPSPGLRSMLVDRRRELSECTPSALCAVPEVLAGHPRPQGSADDVACATEQDMLAEVSRLLCKPGAYTLPSNKDAFRTKDDFWWQELRQRHFKTRRRAARTGTAVEPVKRTAQKPSPEEATSAVTHISREECLQLVTGAARLGWRDEQLLSGISDWLCAGRRHAELTATEVSKLLDALSSLSFESPLMRVSLEHALLRTAAQMQPQDCTAALRGALDVGMAVRSNAVRALLRRCTAELGLIPRADTPELYALGSSIRHAAEQEVLAQAAAAVNGPSLRLPLELHLFSKAAEKHLGKGTTAAFY